MVEKNRVLEKKEDFVDDLHYCFSDIADNRCFFAKAVRAEDGEFERVDYKRLG